MSTPTGEVFRTDGPAGSDTHWRMLRDGTEYGRLFNLSSQLDGKHFNIGATAGELRLFTDVSATFPRLHIMPVTTGITINGYPGNTLSGYVGVGSSASLYPNTLLHLVDGGGGAAYRPWMQSGMTVTREDDAGYFGFKDEGDHSNHTVIVWGDNLPSQSGPDLLKFIFSADNISGNGIAGTDDALEAVRVAPAGSGNESFFGIGDWFTTGANTNPTERLDLLNGRERIRALPDDPAAVDSFYVMVVDRTVATTTNQERGVVNWVDPNDLAGAADCKWTLQGPPGSNSNVSTAYVGNTGCPQDDKAVGIGIQDPKAKLHVYLERPELFSFRGILSDVRNNTYGATAMYGLARALYTSSYNTQTMRGVHGLAQNAKFSYAVVGEASVACESEDAHAGAVIGVFGEARACDNADIAVGVYGKAGGAINGQDWAAYFDGFGFINAPFWVYSDSQLKQNVEDLPGTQAMESLMALQPKSYEFVTDQFGSLALPEGPQRGFISQEVENVLPDLVKTVRRPPVIDSAGTEVEAAMEFKAMNYEGLIPLLVSAIQYQNARIEQLGALLSECCAADGEGRALPADQGSASTTTALETDLRIIPNPVADRTELRYAVGTEGAVHLTITAPDGRTILVQDEGTRATGTYSYGWDTTSLAPGTYHCTLYVNDELVVRKAVKVARR